MKSHTLGRQDLILPEGVEPLSLILEAQSRHLVVDVIGHLESESCTMQGATVMVKPHIFGKHLQEPITTACAVTTTKPSLSSNNC